MTKKPDDLDLIFDIAEGETAYSLMNKYEVHHNTIHKWIRDLRWKYQAQTDAHLISILYHKGILVARRKKPR